MAGHSIPPLPIADVANYLGIEAEELISYGNTKAKVSLRILDRIKDRPQGKYILVTAINPTPLGEGKTTTSIGLAMALNRLGRRTAVTLRQPSLGPVFAHVSATNGPGRTKNSGFRT